MTSLQSKDLLRYLIDQYDYEIVGLIDIDFMIQQPRKILYDLFLKYYKPVFQPNEKIVLFSRNPVDLDVLEHIQKTASLIDISNFFILICAPAVDQQHLLSVQKQFSTDDNILSFLQIAFTDQKQSIGKKSLIPLPETFCFSPWAYLEISAQGEFKPCCVYKESIKDPTGRPYNINVDDVEKVYRSEYLSLLRSQFIQGKKPEGCSNCWFKEEHQGKSNRHWTMTHLGVNAHLLEIEKESIENLISLDIKLGNLCNFKCRICSPLSSSRIAEEQAKHFSSNLNLKDLNKRGQWVENPAIWKALDKIGNNLINIDFYGGEPFLIKQHVFFLDYSIENNHARKIRLHYNSNGSIYPKYIFEKWKHFREIDISFSIDNIGKRFELERGGCWADIDKNLDLFLKTQLPNMILSIFATVSVQNLDRLIDWVETKRFNSLNLNLLETPDFLSITKMNQELSEVIIRQLSKIDRSKLEKYNIQTFIELIKQHKHSSNMIDKLVKYIIKLDKIRNQDFSQTHPEIAEIIFNRKYHGKTI